MCPYYATLTATLMQSYTYKLYDMRSKLWDVQNFNILQNFSSINQKSSAKLIYIRIWMWMFVYIFMLTCVCRCINIYIYTCIYLYCTESHCIQIKTVYVVLPLIVTLLNFCYHDGIIKLKIFLQIALADLICNTKVSHIQDQMLFFVSRWVGLSHCYMICAAH